ncbi:MAG: hypothetical protein N4A49_09190 [Marinifilaceae bacterium]|nr:hypothetical protein [Marinifilaceae bacterium]
MGDNFNEQDNIKQPSRDDFIIICDNITSSIASICKHLSNLEKEQMEIIQNIVIDYQAIVENSNIV